MESLKWHHEVLYRGKSLCRLFIVSLGLWFWVFDPQLLFAQVAKQRVVIAHAAMSPPVLPLWIAVEKGYFAKEGLDVRLVFIRGAPVLFSSMASGEIQAGYTSGPAVLSARARGLDLQIIASMSTRASHDVVAKSEIRNSADLRGKIFDVQALQYE